MPAPAVTAPAGVRAVLFDLDGTLIDSAPDLGAAANAMRSARGLAPLPLPHYRAWASAGARGLLFAAFDMGPQDERFADWRDEFLARYEQGLLQHTKPFAGVTEVLDHLRQRGLAWGIVTNKHSRFTDPIVRGMSCLMDAAVVISGDTTAHAKPHPEPLLEAARRLGLWPSECLYVGDDERDIVAGRAAGMPTVVARYGYLGTAPDVDAWGGDWQIENPLGLLKILHPA